MRRPTFWKLLRAEHVARTAPCFVSGVAGSDASSSRVLPVPLPGLLNDLDPDPRRRGAKSVSRGGETAELVGGGGSKGFNPWCRDPQPVCR